MENNEHKNNHMLGHAENRGPLIRYNPAWDSYYLVVSEEEGCRISQDIWFCPWCGERLPENKADEWHDELERLGIDWLEDEIPQPFKTDEWRLS